MDQDAPPLITVVVRPERDEEFERGLLNLPQERGEERQLKVADFVEASNDEMYSDEMASLILGAEQSNSPAIVQGAADVLAALAKEANEMVKQGMVKEFAAATIAYYEAAKRAGKNTNPTT